jgi:hypothetical protein
MQCVCCLITYFYRMKKLIFFSAVIILLSCNNSSNTGTATTAPQTSGASASNAASARQHQVEPYFAAVAPDNNWSLILNASDDGTFPAQFTTKDGISVSISLFKKSIIETDKQGNAIATVTSNEQKFAGKLLNGDNGDEFEISVMSKECTDNAGVKHLAACTVKFKEKIYDGCGEYK